MNLLEDSVLVIRSTWLVNGDGDLEADDFRSSYKCKHRWPSLHLGHQTFPGGKRFFLKVDSVMKIPHFQLPHILSEPKLVELAAKLKRSPAQVVLRLLFPAVFAYL